MYIFLSTLFFFSISFFASAQDDVKIEFGKKNLMIDEPLVVNVIIKGSDKSVVSNFPDIPGFTKTDRKITHAKGQQHTITQNYTPIKEGSYRVSSFELTINGKIYESEPVMITVAAPDEDEEENKEVISFESLKDNAFLALTIDKSNVYVSEGFRVSLAFYIAETNTMQISFPDNLNAQVDAIAKKIKSAYCLEERINITNIVEEHRTIDDKKFLVYKFFEAIYFPLNSQPVVIPSVELKMDQQKRKSEDKESIGFISKPFTVKVIALPDHPLKDKVVAGNFDLVEEIETRKINTGKSFNYSFKIVGRGNFSTINVASPANDSFFDFYPPDVKEEHNRDFTLQEKEFRYRVVPKDSGQQALDKYFYWIYFNTKNKAYDTLKSKIKIKVLGKAIHDKESGESEDIFAGIDRLDTSLMQTNYQEVFKNISNFLIICMIMGCLYLFSWKRSGK
ncbi:BatD family protein [Emticicia sp. 21SJ11W-3]|uniref:BatD family protein n=1 Tax=Emticicia sp. 21SJ11W-3 TaxID=2916755 RepID=UPI00209C7BBD|nr:BatD family protein [Emticicia sp. 21SJ11W-3]UTA69719.1 BatD family protein [Emticicia sp. 21SJ11W-3]